VRPQASFRNTRAGGCGHPTRVGTNLLSPAYNTGHVPLRIAAIALTLTAVATCCIASSAASRTARLRFVVRCDYPAPPQVLAIGKSGARVSAAGAAAASATRRGDTAALAANKDQTVILRRVGHGRLQRIRWPSQLAAFGNAVINSQRRLIAVSFFDPPPAQYVEILLFNTSTGKFSPLTGLISEDAFKFTSMTWTDEDRLAVLTRLNNRPLLRIWRPGTRKPISYTPPLCRASGLHALIAWP
jgi:hypothetical protein